MFAGQDKLFYTLSLMFLPDTNNRFQSYAEPNLSIQNGDDLMAVSRMTPLSPYNWSASFSSADTEGPGDVQHVMYEQSTYGMLIAALPSASRTQSWGQCKGGVKVGSI